VDTIFLWKPFVEGTIRELYNLSKIYLPICDYWMIFDNSEYPSALIAEGFRGKETEVYVDDIYTKIRRL
jgi:predicted ABC-type ATPase